MKEGECERASERARKRDRQTEREVGADWREGVVERQRERERGGGIGRRGGVITF